VTPEEIKTHLAAGRYYGRESTCGVKQRHDTEEAATKAASNFNNSGKARHEVEAYPCYWCSERFPESGNTDFTHLYWHVGRKMTEQEYSLFADSATALLEMEEVKLQVAEPFFGIQAGEQTLRVHNRKLCEGQFCCIHNPSGHHMKDWPMNWRGDRRLMERLCPHGVGHPDPDDAAYRATLGDNDTTHGCDLCC
jgi:hypothetical protein